MFWRKSEKRIAEDTEEAQRERRRNELKRRVVNLFSANRDAIFTMRHLEQQLAPVSMAALSIVLAELQSDGTIDRIVRVESPENHGGIEDFASLEAVPAELYDWRTQRTLHVQPENISLLFKAHVANRLVPADA